MDCCFTTYAGRQCATLCVLESPEKVAMLLSGHRNRNVFERYNISNGRDVRAEAVSLDVAREREHDAAKDREATLDQAAKFG